MYFNGSLLTWRVQETAIESMELGKNANIIVVGAKGPVQMESLSWSSLQ